MSSVFSKIVSVDLPKDLRCDETTRRSPAFKIVFEADGQVPFPQVIVREGSREHLFNRDRVKRARKGNTYTVEVPAGELPGGRFAVQVEGCKKADLSQAGGGDWVKWTGEVQIEAAAPAVRVTTGAPSGAKLYFGIHKHMHQPYYRAADPGYWDSEKDGIFAHRGGAYTHYVPAAVRQYADAGLPHAGLSTSWSGSLIEQLHRCGRDGLCGGKFTDWARDLRSLGGLRTAHGNPRCDFTAFGFFHPLMALIPARNIVRQIRWHRTAIENAFGIPASKVLFPPETAFHVRMIPALKEAGIEAVIYDSIHRYRACKEYPYAGIGEGMLPPNPAEQENPAVSDWLQLQNVWAGSKISPSLLRPEYIKYEDPDGKVHKIIGVPAERYIGNEDARGGFGALQYPDVLGQVYDNIVGSGLYDPKHPPFFLLHSDGDNYGGGTDSYYMHNTARMVQWLKEDPRFELITVLDYLEKFPPDPARAVHVEPGSWSGADNGDPQFMKWFSRYNEAYSPDLNSWAVLTALQNVVHTLEDAMPDSAALEPAQRLMLTAETSCYWYWTGQDIWDAQVTQAANAAMGIVHGLLDSLRQSDATGPTIFAPWVTPENPGGKCWGQGCLREAAKQGVVHTFVHDLTGLQRVELVLRVGGKQKVLPMRDEGYYPTHTGATLTSRHFTAQLPVGGGDVRYYIEAEDGAGNVSRSALERVFLA